VLSYSFKDSVIKRHFETVDSISSYDTNTYDYKLLKAYYLNDTNYLQGYNNLLQSISKTRNVWYYNDSCIHQPELIDLNIEEAYRFIYWKAFCPYSLNITIGKLEREINLHFIIYKPYNDYDSLPCSIVDEFNKKLTVREWENFEEAMNRADYWALKERNDRNGVDGSGLEIYGCIKGYLKKNAIQTKTYHIYRWGAERYTIGEAFMLLLKYSRNKKGCLVVND